MSSKYFNPKKRANFFDKILLSTPSTNTFDLSKPNKLSFNMGELVPVLTQEVYPGDHFKINVEHLMKTAPLVFPTMHKVKTKVEYFFVPNRLLWKQFEEFQAYDTLNDVPEHIYISLNDSEGGTPVVHPVEVGSLADYMGIPTGDYSAVAGADNPNHPLNKINPLPFMAYWKIIDDYYRDQNLQEPRTDIIDDEGYVGGHWMFNDDTGGVPTSKVFAKGTLANRCWEKDYFTSALPFAQKGQEVVLPLAGTADIEYVPDGEPDLIKDVDGLQATTARKELLTNNGEFTVDDTASIPPIPDKQATLDNSAHLKARLDSAVQTTINDFRVANRLQEFFERNARLGTRYIEQMLGKFGVRISDERAHRAEFIGSTSAPLVFSEVLQTSETETTALGQQAGHGQSINNDFVVNHFCEEHGFIIGILSVIPETNYSQGLSKMFVKEDILDYYDPMFANLGEQAVKNWEIYCNVNQTLARGTFGYQSRFAELKYNTGEVHGEFRTELSPWHMARKFDALPVLNSEFVTSDPTHDIFADTDPSSQKMFAYVHHRIIGKRKIPYFSTPSIESRI